MEWIPVSLEESFRMTCNNLTDPLTFHLAPSSGQTFHLSRPHIWCIYNYIYTIYNWCISLTKAASVAVDSLMFHSSHNYSHHSLWVQPSVTPWMPRRKLSESVHHYAHYLMPFATVKPHSHQHDDTEQTRVCLSPRSVGCPAFVKLMLLAEP